MFTKIERKPASGENKLAVIKYYSMEEVNVTGFCNFCKNNIPLVIAISITMFFTYGIRLFWYSIGYDTEWFMMDKLNALKFILSVLRFGTSLLSKLWYIKEFNPFTAFFTAFCLIWFFTISWCYVIAVFSNDTARNNKLIPFALVFMTMPVWADRFYFLYEAIENALIISLCPYVIYLLFKGFLDSEKRKIICAFILLVFMPSVYQAIVPMFCCGVFICFVLLQENSEYEPKIYRDLCLKLFITLIGSLLVYLFFARIVLIVFHIDKHWYVDENYQWGIGSFRDNIIGILSLGYTLTVGHIPVFQSIVNPIIAGYAGVYGRSVTEMLELSANLSRVFGNILLFPSAVFFLIEIVLTMRRVIPSGRRLLYMLAGIGIPFCIILLAVVTGARPYMRTLYALPLSFAFMLFYLIRTYKKKVAAIVVCLSMLIGIHQAQITAQLYYSDQMRYNEDVRLAYELKNMITQVLPGNEKLPVVIVGAYFVSSQFQANFISGESIGKSFFDTSFRFPKNTANRTRLVLVFMRTLGINFEMPGEYQIEQAEKEAASMPHYPNPGCVKRVQDYIVVRLSENMYLDDRFETKPVLR
jgi:hypothetical protein